MPLCLHRVYCALHAACAGPLIALGLEQFNTSTSKLLVIFAQAVESAGLNRDATLAMQLISAKPTFPHRARVIACAAHDVATEPHVIPVVTVQMGGMSEGAAEQSGQDLHMVGDGPEGLASIHAGSDAVLELGATTVEMADPLGHSACCATMFDRQCSGQCRGQCSGQCSGQCDGAGLGRMEAAPELPHQVLYYSNSPRSCSSMPPAP